MCLGMFAYHKWKKKFENVAAYRSAVNRREAKHCNEYIALDII